MSHPNDYATALTELLATRDEIERLASQLETFAERMRTRPGETCFLEVEGELRPPLDELIPGARWHAPEFPTPAVLQAALRRRYQAREKAVRLWEGLTPQQRGGAPKPPN